MVVGGGGGAAAGAGGGAATGEAGGMGLVAERGGAPWPLAPLVEAVVVREPFMGLRSRLELHDKKGRQQRRDRIVPGSETECWCGSLGLLDVARGEDAPWLVSTISVIGLAG